jgi:hypothetical protein
MERLILAVAAVAVDGTQAQAAAVVQALLLFLTPVLLFLRAVQSQHPVETQSIRLLRRALLCLVMQFHIWLLRAAVVGVRM